MHSTTVHEGWSSRFVFLMAAVGSAVGIGNIWRFPYLTGENGGGAFVLVYLACVIFIAIPILMGELMIGRKGRQSPANSMRAVAEDSGASGHWSLVGWIGVLAGFLILTFYSVIAGWGLAYIFKAAAGAFAGIDKAGAQAVYDEFLRDPMAVTFWHTVFMAATLFIVARGIHGGLEKAVTLLMPAFFVLLVGMVGYAAVAGDFSAGWAFMFEADFSKISFPVVLKAIGQAFFSVGVAMGAMMTYGAYLSRDVSVPKSAFIIAGADTLVAILAGLAIFPLVFAFGLEPDSGPGLVFVTLPIAFGEMPAGTLVGTLFFVLLVFAALTSSISIFEPIVSWAEEHKGIGRKRASLALGGVAWVVGLGSVLSFNHWEKFSPLGFLPNLDGWTFFDLVDGATANIMMPLGGLLLAVFAGWFMSSEVCREELAIESDLAFKTWQFLMRIVVPMAVGVVMYKGLF